MNLMFMVVRITINPGETDIFRSTLAEVVRIARDGAEGLAGYEWFLSPDGRDCTVIEVYDGPAAHAKHVQRVVLPHGSKLREYSSSQMNLAGNVPEEMLSQMRARLGDVPYLGVQVAGLLKSEPADTEKQSGGVSACVVVTGTIDSDKSQRFRELADASVRGLAGNDDVAAFEWFLNGDSGNFTILGMGGIPALLLDTVSDAVNKIRSEGAVDIAVDAVGVDSSEVTEHFGYAKIGRVGGEKIEGIL